MSKFYVYGHYTKDTNELFYIGKGCKNRAWSNRIRNPLWNNIKKKHGLVVKILINKLPETSAFMQEILAIKKFNPRANITPGGIGASGHTPWNKGMKGYMPGKDNPMYGKNSLNYMTPDAIVKLKKKRSINIKRYWANLTPAKRKEFSKKLSKRTKGSKNPMYGKIPWNKGIEHSESTKIKMRERAKNRSYKSKDILCHETGFVGSAKELASMFKSHDQSIREAARKKIKHKRHTFSYV